MSTHAGHRDRLKNRFLEEGLDGFDEINVLELLLFYALPRQDTNPIAHELLNRFGSLAGVLEAPTEALAQIPGMGRHAATLVSLIPALCRRYMVSRQEDRPYLTSTTQCGDYLIPRFFGFRDEVVGLLCLDAKCRVISCQEIGRGSVNSAGVPTRKIVECALAANAISVVLAHNHPSGIALPGGCGDHPPPGPGAGRRRRDPGGSYQRCRRGFRLSGRFPAVHPLPALALSPIRRHYGF